MAKKKDPGAGTSVKKQPARLARAKVKAPDGGSRKSKDGARGSKGAEKPKKKPKTEAQRRADRKKRMTAIIVTIFAILMALSLMLPSCSTVMANRNAQQAAEEAQQESSSSSDSSDSSSSSTDTSTVAGIDSSYQSTVSSLEDKLSSDPDDLATLLGLGNDYMAWGYQVYSIASTDDETSHANELFTKAEGYYDQYLALNDSPMVRTNRALCQFYSGDTAGAQAALEELTQANADFGPAWANLGLVYESQGETDKAKEAYQKAEEADADDEYGAKSFAEARLQSMESSSSSSSSGSSTSSTTSSGATGAQGLSDALGTSL